MKGQRQRSVFHYLLMLMIALAVTSAVWPSHVLAAKDSRPVISAVEIYITERNISCNIRSSGILSEKISGTIRSGLPAVIELFYYLVENDREILGKGKKIITVNYDVWDDIFSITSRNSIFTTQDFDSMRLKVDDLRNIPLFPMSRMSSETSYGIKICISVNPFMESGGSELEEWVDDNVSRRGEGWKEQVLSINELISFFFSRNKDRSRASEWFTSDPFTNNDIPVQQTKQPGRTSVKGNR